MAELAKDPAGQARLQRTEQRINRALSDIVQHEDESAQPAQPSLGSGHTSHEPPSEPARGSCEAPPAPEVADPDPHHEGDEDMGSNQDNMDVEDANDEVMLFLVEQLGGHGRPFARDRKRAFKRIVSEIYSPPRITA